MNGCSDISHTRCFSKVSKKRLRRLQLHQIEIEHPIKSTLIEVEAAQSLFDGADVEID